MSKGHFFGLRPEVSPEFWPELLKLDKQLHRGAQRQTGGWLRHKAEDQWTYDVSDKSEDTGEHALGPHVALWKGTRFLGGLGVQGELNLDQELAPPPASPALPASRLRVIYHVYSTQHFLSVENSGYTDLSNPANPDNYPRLPLGVFWKEITSGIYSSTAAERQLLNSLMRLGASGECRLPMQEG
jgi:hypothetical protein